MASSLPPFLPFLIGAILVSMTRGRSRQIVLLGTPLLGALLLFGWELGETVELDLFGYGLTPVRVDTLSRLFGILFHLAAFLGIVFALHLRDTVQHVAGLLYAGGAIGAVFAGDLLTLFVFWEVLAVSSVFLIWARRTPRALAAGFRYLIIQVVSGLMLLAGVLIHLSQGGELAFTYIGLDGAASWLIFLAFGIKAGFPLLHNWLTDAYPEATPTGTVFLSAFTTKVAIYALARGFPGTELLVYVGAVMTCFPIFYAVIENDLRRVLTYSMINQLGFMVCGIGIGTALSVNGAVAHAFNDVLFKGLLMMSMGAVLLRTGKINGSELGGLYKSMPKTALLCIVGAASISAFPLFSGFVSKSMVMAAALDEGFHWIWLMLLFASAGVFHHAGIKIPFFAFFSHDAGIRTQEAPGNMLIAMTLAALLCIGIGSYPWPLYALLPHALDYSPFDSTHVIAQLQLLFFSALAFVWLKLAGVYPPELPSINIDGEWVYRRLAPAVIRTVGTRVREWDRVLRRSALASLDLGRGLLARSHGPSSVMAHAWLIGPMVFVVVILLGVVLVLNYV